MEIPQYWVKAESSCKNGDGKEWKASGWGWSDSSEAEAQKRAEERASRVAHALAHGKELKGWYLYSDRPIREMIVERHPFGVITRTGYGSKVLNCPSCMFVDVDCPPPPSGLGAFFGRLFGGAVEDPGAAALSRLETFQQKNQQYSFRIYKTKNGFRYLVSSGEFNPESEEVARIMDALGADPLYAKLCRAQKCFRARVSPKPWRCGLTSPSSRFPFASSEERERFRVWEKDYDSAAVACSTAKYLKSIGSKQADSLGAIIELHDSLCRANGESPLA